MDILLNSDILLEYFKNIISPVKTSQAKLVSSIIENESNSIILNHDLIDEYEKIITEQLSDKVDNIYPYLENLITNKSIKVKSKINLESDIYQNAEDEYRKIDINLVCIIYSNFAINKTNSLNNKYSCLIQEIEGINRNKVISTMARNTKNVFTARYYDFTSDFEIVNFFNLLYDLTDRYTQIFIYDRQTNFDHHFFDKIKNTHKINYYTVKLNYNYPQDNNRNIKNKFRYVKIFRSKRQNIHERRILIKELIIEVDNDFWNLNCKEPTWKIDLTVCKETAKELMKKNKLFSRDLN